MSLFEQHVSVAQPGVKSGIAIGGAGASKAMETGRQVVEVLGLSLSDWAALLAAGYTLCLWCEWFWRRCGRPYAEKRGWLQPRKRRAADRE